MNTPFKMRRQGGEANRASEVSPNSYSINQEKTMATMGMKDSGINYGTPMNTGKKKPGDDDFDYTPSTPGAGVTVTADSYNTLEKKIIKAAKDDPSSNRASSSASLRQTSRGNTQTSGMTQAERDKVEQKVSGIQSASSRSGAVQTYERLKNLRKERRNAS